MLPPFVPPSARVPSESLPLITEFVVERGAHAPATAAAQAVAILPRAWTSEDAAELPSIDEFLVERAAAVEHHAAAPAPEAHPEPPRREAAEHEPVHAEAASTVEPGPRPEDQPAAGVAPEALERDEGEPIPPAPAEIILPPVGADAAEVKESTPPGAHFNDAAADAQTEAPGRTLGEAWEASAAPAAPAAEEGGAQAPAAEAAAHSETAQDEWGEVPAEPAVPTAAAGAPEAAWVAEERDAFDWQGVGSIAVGPDEARRAEEAWSGTDWEPRRHPEHEQVATALVQLARRVRAGEVKVELPGNATVEASLAAVLAALLAGEER